MVTAASRLSSFWVKTAVVAGLAAAAIVVSVPLLAGDDDSKDERRVAVTRYIAEVNTTQQLLIRDLARVSIAYRNLRLTADPPPGQLGKIVEAERSLVRLRVELAQLRVPPEAKALHAKLLRLGDLQIAFAHEVTTMVRYLPLQAAEGRKLRTATTRLRLELADADTGEAQRRVFERYRSSVRDAASNLERAEAPPVLEPARREEVTRLTSLASLAGRIGGALEAQRANDVDRLFRAFARTSASAGTTKAERQAVIEFNARLAKIGKQRAAVDGERRRLAVRLG